MDNLTDTSLFAGLVAVIVALAEVIKYKFVGPKDECKCGFTESVNKEHERGFSAAYEAKEMARVMRVQLDTNKSLLQVVVNLLEKQDARAQALRDILSGIERTQALMQQAMTTHFADVANGRNCRFGNHKKED